MQQSHVQPVSVAKGGREREKVKNMNSSYTLRAATESDLAAINEIYNHYVLHSTCTYQDEPETLEERARWFSHHGAKHPIIVAVDNARVVGWGSLSAYHPRSAYRHTVENSVYVHHEYQRQGIGSLLLEELIVLAPSGSSRNHCGDRRGTNRQRRAAREVSV